jgi:hypothetical protein
VSVRLPGRAIATSTHSQRFTVTVSTGGRFAIDLPPGTHQLTGYSPLNAGDRKMRCVAAHPGLRVVHNGAELVDLGDELLQEHAHRNRTESATWRYAKPTHVLWLPRCPVGWHHRGLEPIGSPGPTRLARAPRPPLVLWRYGPLS